MPSSYFITLEGIEGTGKSTAMRFIHDYLKVAQIPLVVTREPGGTEIADAIRQLLLAHHEELMAPDTELLLMFASRAQNLARVIKPALAANQWVLCDRFTDASYAYQGGGRGISHEHIATLENWVHPNFQPHITFLLDAPAHIGLTRIEERKTKDRIEREQVDFFERVRQVYLERAKKFPERFKIIDASGDIESVERQLTNELNKLLEITSTRN